LRSRALRVTTLLFAVGVLVALTVHAGMNAGCSSTLQGAGPRGNIGNAGARPLPDGGARAVIPLAQPEFLPATKAGPMLRPDRPRPAPPQQSVPQERAP
jgi:hypothetical protein